mmetsp:Transcript_4028/g.11396  ORF Transcript_4028/g.11396 Transcript_4028/m.11396 type:complete len:207 (+) Transcript_4028:3074-3694(+)
MEHFLEHENDRIERDAHHLARLEWLHVVLVRVLGVETVDVSRSHSAGATGTLRGAGPRNPTWHQHLAVAAWIVHDLSAKSQTYHVINGGERHGRLGGVGGDDDLDLVLLRLIKCKHLFLKRNVGMDRKAGERRASNVKIFHRLGDGDNLAHPRHEDQHGPTSAANDGGKSCCQNDAVLDPCRVGSCLAPLLLALFRDGVHCLLFLR